MWGGAGNARGLQVASALAVSPDGTPLGVCGQTFWARTAPVQRHRRKRYRSHLDTEMGHAVTLMHDTHALLQVEAPGVTPWFQLDRGYDAKGMILTAHDSNMLMTIRVHENRRVRENKKQPIKYLHRCIDTAPVLGHNFIHVPARNGCAARIAKLEIRARKVTLELRLTRKRSRFVSVYVVSAREMHRKTNPLRWRLMTTYPVASFEDGLRVIQGYTTRWRVEEFHRAWKNGVCRVEDTQLRGRENIIKWATILAAVASRAIRLTYLAREQPDLPAAQEFSRWEIDAAIALLRPKGVKLGAEPTLQQLVEWIAEIGGFAGKYSKRPPGQTVIARGLERVESFAQGLKNLSEM
jgi:hypothetical protein